MYDTRHHVTKEGPEKEGCPLCEHSTHLLYVVKFADGGGPQFE